MYEKYLKRMLDCFLSGISIVVLSPVIFAVALLVRLKLGSPVIFKQARPGRNEQLFQLYKFRTMTDERDAQEVLLPDEERLNEFGRFLRTTSLDELPELVNIFKGDMAIVGPRPLLVRYLPFYKEKERIRHSVRPGLTGLAQISGRNNLNWDARIALDVQYVKHITFASDFKIILQTLGKVIKRNDVASGKQLLMQDLDVEREWILRKEKIMADIQFRNLQPDDIKQNRDELIMLMDMILADNITQKYPPDLASQYVYKMSAYLNDGSAIIVGAFYENKLVGFAWAYVLEIFDERRLHIDMLGVNSKFRRNGIAKTLLAMQMEEATKRNIYKIEAMLSKANENTYHWYHSIGFEDERVKVKLELSND